MCGIAARFAPNGQATPQQDVLASLVHRGPDAQDSWSNTANTAWLGHCRLAIVDLSAAGQQPMVNETGTLRLVCNGEIYNYPQLRQQLEAEGHTFSSNSDSEVVLHAYEQWGDDCLTHFQGMFAFALWDETRQRLLAARDGVGIKPLYFAAAGGRLALASEANALKRLMPSTPQLDATSVAYMLSLGYVPSPRCIWSGMAKLDPGHALTWSAEQGVQTYCYWQPPDDEAAAADRQNADFAPLFQQVMEEHLLSDVPIGLFLSGGLDSSAVAAALRDLHHRSTALTVTFPGKADNEGPIAAAVAQHLGFERQPIALTVDDVWSLIQQTVATYDEPQGYSALLSMMLLCQHAREHFKVVFAGDGGDEAFGGYTWHADARRRGSRVSQTIWPALRAWLGSGSVRAARTAARHYAKLSPLHQHAWRLFPRFLPAEIQWLLQPQGIEFDEQAAIAPLQRYDAPRLDRKRALQRIDLMTFCSDSILPKVDRASMACSLEVRVPLLDKRIVQWGLTRPPDASELTDSKPPLREYLRPRVLASVLDHPKQGFSLRVLDRFDWQRAIDRIDASTLVQEEYCRRDWQRLVQPGVPYREARIWTLLMLSQWVDHQKEAA